MNKTDLIEKVATDLRTTKAEATRNVEAVLGAIADGVKDDQKVTIAGFGTFLMKQRAGRTGVNPITKAPIEIKPSKTCTFRASPALKGAL
jgi:DNA-binding protein HU-beta